MMMITLNPLARQKEGVQGQGEDEAGGISKKMRPNRNSDIRCGCSHRSLSVRGVGCEEQEKTWTVVRGFSSAPGCRMRGTGENMDGGMGFYSSGRAEGA